MKKFILAALIGLVASPVQAGLLEQVQNEAEQTIEQVSDVEDTWVVAQGKGDCEDIVLWKRQRLIDLGWDAGDLAVMVVESKGATAMYKGKRVRLMHVVLVSKSQNKVLDNQHTKVPMFYKQWLRKFDYKQYCEVEDFVTERKALNERCF